MDGTARSREGAQPDGPWRGAQHACAVSARPPSPAKVLATFPLRAGGPPPPSPLPVKEGFDVGGDGAVCLQQQLSQSVQGGQL